MAVPSTRLLRSSVALSGLGVLLAGYLAWVHFNTGSLVCNLGDCHTVQASEYATIGPLPVALLGLGMYAAVCTANMLVLTKPESAVPVIFVSFAMLLAGTVFAAYLTWLEVAVIRAICQWCVVSAVFSVVLLVIQSVTVREVLADSAGGAHETGSHSLTS